MDKMEAFVLLALGVARTIVLCPKVGWGENGPEIRMVVNSRMFRLRQCEGNYDLFAENADGETEIATIEAVDPIFGSRLMVSLGRALKLG